jgi:hypothetical protein
MLYFINSAKWALMERQIVLSGVCDLAGSCIED